MPKVVFVINKGKKIIAEVNCGESVLNAAKNNDIDLEGSCEGAMACSTCHVIVESKWYDRLKPPEDEEIDMLDLSLKSKATSRLGCQILITNDIDGLILYLPE